MKKFHQLSRAVFAFCLAASALQAAPEAALQRRADLPPLRYTNVSGKTASFQLPLTPSESALHLVAPSEFITQLWAAEPDILPPFCVAWDERGRLWIAERSDKSAAQDDSGENRDRIRICEDTDGDGHADRFTLFAEKLSNPSAMTFGNSGLIVIEGGRTLFLKDNDGDGKADEKAMLFEGWGTEDGPAAASSLRYGLDNWIWGVAGPRGFDGMVKRQHVKFGPGVFRFKPDGSALEFVKAGSGNTGGLGFSEEGFVFGSSASNNASWYMPIPNRFYEAVSGWSAGRMETIANSQALYPIGEQLRQPRVPPRFIAASGHAIYTARSFPKNYWNKIAFVAEPTGHLVGQFQIEARGSDFVALNQQSFVASDDEWAAPIAAEVGPDGALWVIDAYQPTSPTGSPPGVGNSKPTPESSLRDKPRARIYRVAWNKAVASPRLSLAKATAEQLAAALGNDNQLWRLHAQRLMIERGRRDMVPTLFALVREPAVDEMGLNIAAMHALWTLHGMGSRDPKDLSLQNVMLSGLRHPSACVRRAAAAVIPRNAVSLSGLLASAVLSDPDAQVRLAAFLALAEMPPSEPAGAPIFAALKDATNTADRWIPDAVIAAAARHDASFLTAVFAGGSNLPPASASAIRIVTRHYAQRGPLDSILPTLLALSNSSPSVAVPLLEGLAVNWPADKVPALTQPDEAKLVSLFKTLSDEARAPFLALADRWSKRSVFAGEVAIAAKSFCGQMENTTLTDVERCAAARRLLSLSDNEESVGMVLGQINPLSTPELAGGLINALGRSRSPQTAPALIASLNKFTPATRRAALAALLRRPDWSTALLESIEKRELQRTDLASDHWADLKAHPNGAILVKARELDKGVPASTNANMEALTRKLLPVARQKGDAAKGREIFTKSCAICHAFDGQLSKIGPDLTGIGTRPRQDILVDIIDPNRSVEASYRQWNVTTKTGDVIAGRLDTETATVVEVLDMAGQRHAIQRQNLAEMTPSAVSLMPQTFDQLPESDLAALLEYLTAPPSSRK